MPRRCAVFLWFALAAAACRPPAGPDSSYQKALALYQSLYATQLDDAYADPRMAEVVALLKKVDSRSLDADAAKALLGTIDRGRETLTAERAAREKMAAAARASAAQPAANIDVGKILAASAPPPEDAGPPQDPYGEGASVSEINRTTGGCLAPAEPFQETGTNNTGTIYRLAQSPVCAEKMPGFVGQAVLVVADKIYRRIRDPNPPPPPRAPQDAGPPPRPAASAAPAEDGGAPPQQLYYPGQPRPGAVAPDAGG